MIQDAFDGKIDLILTKSVSRFARNVVDTVQTVRDLKAHNVEVWFEQGSIHSFDSKSDSMLSMLGAMAQEESRVISENVSWGKRKSMMDGHVSFAYSRFLGYRKGPDGKPEIDEEEAAVVRKIYSLFLDEDQTLHNIAKYLNEQGVPTPSKKPGCKWSVQTVKSILTNEKYKGDALLQKSYVEDYLTKRSKKNNGERVQYYVHGSHPAIIEPSRWDLVQHEFERRSVNRHKISNNSPFTTRIVCDDCGGFFGHKVYHSGSRYETHCWYCNHRYEGDKVCQTPIIKESLLKSAFEEALGQVLARTAPTPGLLGAEGPEVEARAAQLQTARDRAEQGLQAAIADLKQLVEDNTRRSQDQTLFRENHTKLEERVKAHQQALFAANAAIMDEAARKERCRRFEAATKNLTVDEVAFSDTLFLATVEQIQVSIVKNSVYHLRFKFMNGEEVDLERTTK